jgi:hypothetical protein
MQDYEKKQQATKDDDKKQNLAPLVQASQAAQTRLALFADPSDPTKAVQGKEAEYGAAHDQLADIIGKMRTVLHPPPADDPHGLGYLAHRATDKLHITRDLAQRARDNQSGKVEKYNDQTGQNVQATVQGIPPKVNPDIQKMNDVAAAYKATFGADMPADKQQAFFNHLFGGAPLEPKETPTKFQPQLAETTDAEGKKHYWRVPLETGGEPEEVDFKGQKVSPKGGEKPPNAVGLNLESYENSFNPPVKWAEMSPQQKAGYPAWKTAQTAMTTTSTDVKMVQQGDQWIPVTVQKTSTRGGASRPSVAPKNPATKTSQNTDNSETKAKPKGAGVVSVGDPIGQKKSAAENKAEKDYVDAVRLDSVARQVEAKPEDAINQKRLAVALERMSAGRFTTQALDYVIKAGWGNTIEQWVNNPQSGALPKDVVRQLVEGAHQNLVSAREGMAAAKKLSGQTGGGGSKPKVSLKKAMALQRNKGKSEAEVRKDIEAYGNEVIP